MIGAPGKKQMDTKALRALRTISALLAAILILLAYKILGPEYGSLIFCIVVICLPIALFPVSPKK